MKVLCQVRILDFCKEGGGGAGEMLPTSCRGVASVTKIWAEKIGGREEGGGLDPQIYTSCINRTLPEQKVVR